MIATRKDLDDFYRFAEERISAGQAESLEQVLKQWLKQRELEAVADDYRQGMEDYQAGKGVPLDQAIRIIRQRGGN